MKVAEISKGSLVNGPGLRTVIFFQGCPRQCPGCFNPLTQPYIGEDITPSKILTQLKEIINKKTILEIDGITLSGGDPLYQPKEELVSLLKGIRRTFPKLDIWCWTGYKFKDIPNKQALEYIDVIIDGKFEKDNPTTKDYRGSDNQKMWKQENKEWREVKNE